MSSSAKRARNAEIGVRISKYTGGAYADIREVIKSELARIREESFKATNSNGSIRSTDNHANGNGRPAK